MQRYDTVAICGVGLIGGSIGLALQQRRLARRIIGIGRRPESLARAAQRGCITEIATGVAEGVQDADLAVICTPVDAIAGYVAEIGRCCADRCLITDAGSTKQPWIAEAEASLTTRFAECLPFVGSHPIAGSEQSGPDAASADLFVNRVTVVTPTDKTSPSAVSVIAAFWEMLGSRVRLMSPETHDAALARSSHLPHLVAAVLAVSTPDEVLPLTGGGWQDTTRIAAGDAELWRQILLSNRGHTLKALDDFERVLAGFRAALESADGAALSELLLEGKRRRDALGN